MTSAPDARPAPGVIAASALALTGPWETQRCSPDHRPRQPRFSRPQGASVLTARSAQALHPHLSAVPWFGLF